MTATTLTLTVTDISGEPMLCEKTMSLLFGVPVADIKALPVIDGSMRIPADWTRRGRRRMQEAFARLGDEDMWDAIEYWAREDLGAEVEWVRR